MGLAGPVGGGKMFQDLVVLRPDDVAVFFRFGTHRKPREMLQDLAVPRPDDVGVFFSIRPGMSGTS